MANIKMSAFVRLMLNEINDDSQLITLSGIPEVGKPLGKNTRIKMSDFVEYIVEKVREFGTDGILIVDELPQMPTPDDDGFYVVRENVGSISLHLISGGIVRSLSGFEIFQNYNDIPEMLLDAGNQNENKILRVKNASDDPNLSFANTETKRQAFYRYNGTSTGSLDDYTLISAPYSGSQGGVQSVTGDGVDNTDPENPVLTFPTLQEVTDEGNTTTKNISITSLVNTEEKYIQLYGLQKSHFSITGFGIPAPISGFYGIKYMSDRILSRGAGGEYLVRGQYLFPDLGDNETEETIATEEWVKNLNNFTTQIIDTGGNYNDLEVTADLLVFTNENAQAILNGIWGRKEFHILNLSSQYEILINHDSSSVSGNGQPIMLPTNSGTAGIKGTARVLQTDSYGYFVADTWGSKYRPEFSELTEDKVMLVGADHRAKAEDIIELKYYRTNQSTAMDSTELENDYPDSIQGTEVICTPINKKYEKINNLGDWVEIDFATV